ncbi:MAG: hypothetical protein ACOZNI_16405, partial [Myxococcota bacterium]
MNLPISRASAAPPPLPRAWWNLLAYASGPVAPLVGPALVWATHGAADPWVARHAARAAALQLLALAVAFALGVAGQVARAALP